MNMNAKKKLVISYKNCTDKILEAIRLKYPAGWSDDVIKIDKPDGSFFHAITVETDEACYLVKVDVKIDDISPEDLDKALEADMNNEGEENDTFENDENAPMDQQDESGQFDE